MFPIYSPVKEIFIYILSENAKMIKYDVFIKIYNKHYFIKLPLNEHNLLVADLAGKTSAAASTAPTVVFIFED